jgi:hypothetical protein
MACRLQREAAPYGDRVAQALFQNSALQEDMQAQMRQMDRTLERYHAGGNSSTSLGSRRPQPEVLRLQALQQTGKQQPRHAPAASSSGGAQQLPQQLPARRTPASTADPARGERSGDVNPGAMGDGGGGSVASSPHSELTFSVNSSTPVNRRPGVEGASRSAQHDGTAGPPRSGKGRQASAAFAAATSGKGSGGDSSQEAGASKLSALQLNALRSLSAPASDVASASSAAAAGASQRRHQDELIALVSQLAGTAPANGGARQPPPVASTVGAPRSGEKAEAAANPSDPAREARAAPKLGEQGRSKTAGPAPTQAQASAAPALSLKGSAYKSMSEIKQQGPRAPESKKAALPAGSGAAAVARKAPAQPAAAAPSPAPATKGAAPMPQPQQRSGAKERTEGAGASGAPAATASSSRPAAARAPAPYAMQAHRGVLEGNSGPSGDRRSGGVATTVVATGGGRQPMHDTSAEELDETLALALQLSLEDSRPSPHKRRPVAEPAAHSGPGGGYNPPHAHQYAGEQGYMGAGGNEYHNAVAAADAAILETRRMQELFDAEAAAELMRYEAEHEAAEREHREQLARYAQRPALQHRVQYGNAGRLGVQDNYAAQGPVPMGLLDRAMTEEANAGLLDLAAAESFAQHYGHNGPAYRQQPQPAHAPLRQQARPQQQQQQQQQRWIGGVGPDGAYLPARDEDMQGGAAPAVFYDQEDEMLAQAIEDSLNAEDWQY